ncbi:MULTISPECIES: DoxX family membrane protein [unclassified Beijerinckia]|uniref:DoxX family protein n=1 Tax=unclassified Beijerinckia TaxID=2638183 RepID=UPI000896A491|nr:MULTISPECIES: DoxX family membrane protein [unclassified Beijerinckia]MDH7794256.1 thiosulfate dehydrogenase [quinone] large subunit [Beijerinckia sp. GAS462]SEB56992.1 thiosulfate dehydrogenase [quinone] large subunit [Beijerinckia sp. 28-YEA-48]
MERQSTEKIMILYFRVVMAWTFLYPGIRQVLAPEFSVSGFLSHTKTFNGLFSLLASPPVSSIVSFLVAYGHLLIGVSLLLGFMVRISAPLGALMMILYWMAHMDWPYIENKTNFIVDQHLVFAGLLIFLAIVQAGRFWGLDAMRMQANKSGAPQS